MRKLFWCSVAVAVSTACGVYLASKSVDHSSAIVAAGQAMLSLAGEEASGKGTTEESLGLPQVTPIGEVGDAPGLPTAKVVVVDPTTPGHIGIDDGMPMVDPAVETPALPVNGVINNDRPDTPAPSLMPYAADGEESGLGRMPYSSEEESEPHPKLIGEIWDMLRQVAREAVSDPMSGTEEEKTEQAVPDHHPHHGHHDHGMVCPYTGRYYLEHPIAPAAPESTPSDETPKNNNEKKTPEQSVSKKVVMPELDDDTVATDDDNWPEFNIDTMEFRPSDAGFQPMLTRPF